MRPRWDFGTWLLPLLLVLVVAVVVVVVAPASCLWCRLRRRRQALCWPLECSQLLLLPTAIGAPDSGACRPSAGECATRRKQRVCAGGCCTVRLAASAAASVLLRSQVLKGINALRNGRQLLDKRREASKKSGSWLVLGDESCLMYALSTQMVFSITRIHL
jgi:hypothetical protein